MRYLNNSAESAEVLPDTCPDSYATRALLCPGSETIRGSGMPRLQSYRPMKLVYNEFTFGIRKNKG
ncbi:MAG: hypothetical protein IT216_13420 [Saprospiraceae bacterium]|nr:MAG: hypothetical protein UZ08_BCD001001687 [Candidatus Parvibacillus calidus]MCC7150216.1 hypothetical protein [Saprospiraceae bacterium]WKZ62131.1 MAG: hypothetical protein QY315_10230 [Saprospiraceae bacterium]